MFGDTYAIIFSVYGMWWSSNDNDCWQLDEINLRHQAIHGIHNLRQTYSSCHLAAVQSCHSLFRRDGNKLVV